MTDVLTVSEEFEKRAAIAVVLVTLCAFIAYYCRLVFVRLFTKKSSNTIYVLQDALLEENWDIRVAIAKKMSEKEAVDLQIARLEVDDDIVAAVMQDVEKEARGEPRDFAASVAAAADFWRLNKIQTRLNPDANSATVEVVLALMQRGLDQRCILELGCKKAALSRLVQ